MQRETRNEPSGEVCFSRRVNYKGLRLSRSLPAKWDGQSAENIKTTGTFTPAVCGARQAVVKRKREQGSKRGEPGSESEIPEKPREWPAVWSWRVFVDFPLFRTSPM